jgi:hypothetical protein
MQEFKETTCLTPVQFGETIPAAETSIKKLSLTIVTGMLRQLFILPVL